VNLFHLQRPPVSLFYSGGIWSDPHDTLSLRQASNAFVALQGTPFEFISLTVASHDFMEPRPCHSLIPHVYLSEEEEHAGDVQLCLSIVALFTLVYLHY
jgi:hypothetical protein